MSGWTVMLGFGWCGFGWCGGLLPELRLGLVRVAWCRGWIGARVQGWQLALAQTVAKIRGVGA
jgi:hypothetical protein